MAELFTNNAESTLASGINNSVLSMDVASGHGSRFPSPSGGDFFYLTLESGSTREIVKVTARASDTMTIVRAQQGTSAASWSAGATIELRITAAALTAIIADAATKIAATLVDAKGDILAGTANDTVARVAVGSNGQVLVADSAQTPGLKWGGTSAQVNAQKVGWWYGPETTANDTTAHTAGHLHIQPWELPPGGMPIDRLGVFVSTGVASSLIRIGYYIEDSEGLPTGVPYEFGTVSTATSATNAILTLGATHTLVGVRVWIALLAEVGSPTMRRVLRQRPKWVGSPDNSGAPLVLSSVANSPGYVKTGVSAGALPTLAATDLSFASSMTLFGLRRA